MRIASWPLLPLVGGLLVVSLLSTPAPACCPAPPPGIPVVNADQTVILIWDAARHTQHFIRQASFKSDADDFGFLVPSPTQPDLDESGDDAFDTLRRLTEPEVKQRWRLPSLGIGCGAVSLDRPGGPPRVEVLQEKRVAGFDAVVLQTTSAAALADWLGKHGYAFSPEVQVWAKPYVEAGWKITALKVAKEADDKHSKDVAAASLRMSFKTIRPLFPYREPDPSKMAGSVDAKHRLLRIYFIAEARYQGELTREAPWTGKVVWSGKLSDEARTKIQGQLRLPPTTGPARWWLTEFEDDWPYRAAPTDVYFSRSADQSTQQRPPIEYGALPSRPDIAVCALAAAVIGPPLLRRFWRTKGKAG
jgi:hypothetical protein